jgi:hypothetical protein
LCFILGAGFSCAYSDQAPTMGDFLSKAEARGVYGPDHDHKIRAAVAERYFGTGTAVNVEDLATFLLVDFGSNPIEEMEWRPLAYDQLISIISKTMAFDARKVVR